MKKMTKNILKMFALPMAFLWMLASRGEVDPLQTLKDAHRQYRFQLNQQASIEHRAVVHWVDPIQHKHSVEEVGRYIKFWKDRVSALEQKLAPEQRRKWLGEKEAVDAEEDRKLFDLRTKTAAAKNGPKPSLVSEAQWRFRLYEGHDYDMYKGDIEKIESLMSNEERARWNVLKEDIVEGRDMGPSDCSCLSTPFKAPDPWYKIPPKGGGEPDEMKELARRAQGAKTNELQAIAIEAGILQAQYGGIAFHGWPGYLPGAFRNDLYARAHEAERKARAEHDHEMMLVHALCAYKLYLEVNAPRPLIFLECIRRPFRRRAMNRLMDAMYYRRQMDEKQKLEFDRQREILDSEYNRRIQSSNRNQK